MTRPLPRYRTEMTTQYEASDRADVQALGSYPVPLAPANVAATQHLDSLTVAAGLTGGWAGLNRRPI